jgi:type IV secretion system protein VirB11
MTTNTPTAKPAAATAANQAVFGIKPKIIDDGFKGDTKNRIIIRHLVRPLLKWLEHPEVEEVQINRPGEIIQRLRYEIDGSVYAYHLDPELDRRYLTMVAHAVANNQNMSGFGVDRNPVVYGALPGGHRFVCAIGQNIQYHDNEIDEFGSVCMVIRQFTPQNTINLKNYGLEAGRPLDGRRFAGMTKSQDDDRDPLNKILNSLTRGDHILISGATGTGKTTLMRALLDRIDQRYRVITVEDTREVVVPHRNHCHIVLDRAGASNDFNYKSVVDLIVRVTPDVVMAGEISTKNAAAIWELMRSGHGHFMTTIHANNTSEALETFMTRISHEAPNEVLDRERVRREMKGTLRVIQIERVNEVRKITQID